jgi:hypothetical protein
MAAPRIEQPEMTLNMSNYSDSAICALPNDTEIPMENKLSSKQVLSVFDKIRQHGEQLDGKYILEGISASTDFDGYTLFLSDALVSLSFGFHNQYHFDYEDPTHLEQFEKKLKRIDDAY